MTEMTEQMYEELKNTAFENGVEAINDLLGYEHNVNEDKSTIESRMDEVLDQIPEEEALALYEKYCMRPLYVTVQCMATYNSKIMVPAKMKLDEAIGYANEHKDDIPLGEMTYVPDSDELDEENCSFDE